MWVRTVTLLVWAAVAASALFWGLKLLVKAPPAPPQAQVAQTGGAVRGDLSRLLGVDAPPPAVAAAPEPAPDSRFNLVGVVSPRPRQAAGEAVALIAVDGKPARAYRVGAVVDGSHVLQSVSARGANLGPRGGASVIALNIAPPAAAATGLLPPALPQPGMPHQPQPAIAPMPAPPPQALPPQIMQPEQGQPPPQPQPQPNMVPRPAPLR